MLKRYTVPGENPVLWGYFPEKWVLTPISKEKKTVIFLKTKTQKIIKILLQWQIKSTHMFCQKTFRKKKLSSQQPAQGIPGTKRIFLISPRLSEASSAQKATRTVFEKGCTRVISLSVRGVRTACKNAGYPDEGKAANFFELQEEKTNEP